MKRKTVVKRVLAGAALAGLITFARMATAEPVRLLIAVSNKNGLPAERPLKFSENDAKRVRDVMVGLGGVRTEHAFLLAEPTRTVLYDTIDRAKAEAAKHRADEVTLVFYFSGHGDREAVHVGSDRVLLSQLGTKLAEVPASLRIAVTDACRSTRDKGFAADEPFAISATMIPQASGQVWLHASSDGEAAQESDELQGAIFTHAWLNGLRGAADANGDARVTLDESFAFAHSQTLIRSSKSSGVMQKPEAVVSLREAAPVVLTQTAAHLGTLALPQARDAHFLVYSAGAKSVLSEVWGSPDRRLRLRVPPGRYVIQRRAGGAGAVAQIAVAEGEERALEERDFSLSSLEVLARKGDGSESERDVPDAPLPRASSSDNELTVGYDAGANNRSGLVHGPRIGFAHALGNVALVAGGGVELSGRDLANGEERLVAGYGRAGVELRLPVARRVALRFGGAAKGGVLGQTVRGANAAEGTTFFLGPELVVGARASLGETWFLDANLTGNLVFLKEEARLLGVFGAGSAAALGVRF